MVRFGSPRKKRRDSKDSYSKRGDSKDNRSKRDTWGKRRFEGGPRGRRDSSRDSNRHSGGRRELEMTKVTCASCGDECEVPFKPTSNKPVYCRDCFSKKEGGSSGNSSNRDLDMINKKLDKIMKALDIR
ncbi:MAG: CxxC-x17-CxxC domain-containing protein [Nanoarchaeota archaeon]|nr:CxxC-x17-CxxC domain-containing protein [Nanoarchaeota archaeon]